MDRPRSRLDTLKSAALIATSTYVTTGLGLLVSVIVARSLGPDDFGQYAYMLWLTGLLMVFGNHGLGVTGIRFVAESLGRGQPEEARNIHGWLRRQQWKSVLVVLVLFCGLALIWPPVGWQEPVSLLLLVCVLSVIAKAIFIFDVSIAKGYGRFSVEALTNMAMSVIYAGGVGVLGYIGADLQAFVLFFAAVSLAHILMVSHMLRQAGIFTGSAAIAPDVMARLKPHLGWTIVLMLVAALSNKTIETFLLSHLVGPAEVGFFTIASALTRGGIDLLSSTLTTMLMPMMGHAFGAGGLSRVNDILSDALRYFLFIGLTMAGLGSLWAAPGVHLMYGPEFTSVVNVLRVMMIVGGLTLGGSAFGALLSTTDNQKMRASISLLSVLISAVAAFALVPTYGLNGAVISFAVTQVLIVGIMALLIRRYQKVSLPFQAMFRLLCASALGALAVLPLLLWSTELWMQVVAGPVYVAVFIAATFWLRAWRHKDAALLLTVLEARPQTFRRLLPWVQGWASQLPR